MSPPVRLERPFLRGSVLASGMAFDTRLIGEDAARLRIVRRSTAGLDVFRVGPLLVARFSARVRVRCDAAVGAPLLEYDRLLSPAPLTERERAALGTGVPAVLVVSAGAASIAPIEDATREDPSTWLDVSRFRVQRAAIPLGEAPVPAPTTAIPPVPTDLRSSLGIPPLAAEGTVLLARPSSSGRTPARRNATLARVLAFVARALLAFLAPPEKSGGSPASREPSWFARLRAALARAAERLVDAIGLGALLDRAYAKYLARLLEMLDRNDVDGALRHAIPLTSSLEQRLQSPALLPPRPRSSLAIVPHRAAVGSGVGLAPSLFELLKAKYRRTFERLVQAGDIEKAAFVLAELLDASEEAVSFLERHGRRKLAAEIAEARNLPPGLVVRQWFLAGDKARAVAVARRTGAFADAVARLERSHAAEAKALRLLWADTLADAGSYAAAVDAAWPVEEARGVARAWLDRAIAVGGLTGARMLVRKIRLEPASFPEVRDRLIAVLADEDDYGRAQVRAFGNEVLAGELNDELRVLAKGTARSLLDAEVEEHDRKLVERLVVASGDGVLRADVTACNRDPRQPARDSVRDDIRVVSHAITDVGNCRTVNEDGFVVESLGGSSAVLLGAIDGCGGMSSASNVVARVGLELARSLKQDFPVYGADLAAWERCVDRAIRRVNRDAYRYATENPVHRGSGAAATIATPCGTALVVAQIGDTRAYLLRDGQLAQLTRDHSLVNDYLAAGKLTPEEYEDFPHKNVITRVLGMNETTRADLRRVELCRGDVVLLCSDGLHAVVDEKVIARALGELDVKPACEALIAAAKSAGAPDNIVVVAARFDGPGLPVSRSTPIAATPQAPLPDDDEDTLVVPHPARIVVRRSASDAGTLAVTDAAELPDGRVLVALGELGARMLARDGRTLAQWSEPAHHLVLSDHGDRAILLAPRGEAVRLARVDLVTRRVRPWCDAILHQFARDFDGGEWFVSRGGALYAVDATSEDWEFVWSVVEKEANVISIARDARNASACFETRDTLEQWHIEVTTHTLRKRHALDGWVMPTTSPGGHIAGWKPSDETLIACVGEKVLPQPSSHVGRLALSDDWVVLIGRTSRVFERESTRERARLELEPPAARSHQISLRIQGDRLVAADSAGRVLVLSLLHGRVLTELRVS